MTSELMGTMQKRLMTLDADADHRAEQAATYLADGDPRGATAAALMAIERRLAGAMLFPLVMVADDEDPPRDGRRRRRSASEASDMTRPEVVCLCGSTRFLADMAIMAWELEKLGRIVLSMQLLPQSYPGVVPDHQAEAEGVKEAMDELHLRKIDLADRVLVIDVGADGAAPYIGESTRREIAYATRTGKPVDYISKCEGLAIEEPLPRGDNQEGGATKI